MNQRQFRSVSRILVPGASLRHVSGFYDLLLTDAAEVLNDIRLVVLNLLEASSAITSITENITVGWIDQRSTFPALTINIISDQPFISLSGSTQMSVARIQVDSWATSNTQAIALKRAVYDCLQTRSGSVTGTTLYKVRKIGETDLTEPPRNNSSKWTHRISQDFAIQYKIASTN